MGISLNLLYGVAGFLNKLNNIESVECRTLKGDSLVDV